LLSNGTAWEHDIYGTQLRHGGDTDGVRDSLDYLQGMGIKGIYLAGSIFYNFPWSADTYSPLVCSWSISSTAQPILVLTVM